jgi:hypothetical protein
MLKKNFFSLAAVCIILPFILTGCNGIHSSGKTGDIQLTIEPLSRFDKTIVPPVSMEPASYTITGTGPDSETFSLDTTNQAPIINDLAFGSWTITVDAENDTGTLIGSGTATVDVATGMTTPATVLVQPIDGTGALDLTVTWNGEVTENPWIDAELIPVSGSPIVLNFTISGGNSGTCITTDLQAGYYTLIVKLMDNSVLTIGIVEITRIVNDETTTGSFEFSEINNGLGSIDVDIELDMKNPLTITMTGQVLNIDEGDEMTVSATAASSIPPESGNVTYVWYLNGEAQDIGGTYTLGSDLSLGVYNVSVTGISADGSRAGSTTHTFHVLEQTITWEKTFGGTNFEEAKSIQQTLDGGYIAAGNTTSFGAGSDDFYVIKMDEEGNEEWSSTYGNSLLNLAHAVRQTSDGGFVVAGMTKESNNLDYDIYVVKLDSLGNVQWENEIGAPETEQYAFDIQQTSDNGYILAGYDNFSLSRYFLVMKLNSAGTEVWSNTYGTGAANKAYSVKQTMDGGYIAAGYNETTGDIMIVKIDASGNEEWLQIHGSVDATERVFSIQQTIDGGYVAAGYSLSDGDLDCYVIKMDTTGNEEWTRVFGGPLSDTARSIQQTSDGGYVIGGIYEKGAFDGTSESYIVKLDTFGNEEWAGTFGGDDEEMAYSVQQTADGGYVLAGRSESFGAGNFDFYILKLSQTGQL